MAFKGLSVVNGELRLNGNRFRNIGLNYGGAIVPIFNQPSASVCNYTSSADQDAMLAIAVQAKAKVLRIKAFPYWPAQWTVGVNAGKTIAAATAADREAHYQKIDAFIAKCRALGIGVIINLFFRHVTISDLAGQTVRAGWLTGGSATRNFAQTITQEVVTRYLNDDSVYGYEFSNEVNHYNDASDASKGNYPAVSVPYGSLASYAAVDTCFNGSELSSVLAWWYSIVQAIDNQRICLSGNGPNSYSQPGGVAGISSPMREWHLEQVRDNPTNCGSIHWYGNVGYSSPNFHGLDAVLTGCKHWQKENGRGFVVGEFGNQAWNITSISGNGTTATIGCNVSCPVQADDQILIAGTGSVFDGKTVTVTGTNANRSQVTVSCDVTGTFTGSARALQFMTAPRLTKMLDDIIKANIDVALMWMIDSDPLRPALESIHDANNTFQIALIADANTRLGW